MPAQLLDFDEGVLWRILTYGYAGSGKTTFGASAHWDLRTAPALHIDFGGNAASLKRFPREKRPTVLLMRDMQDFNPIYDWLYNGQPEAHYITRTFDLKPGFKTVTFDGFTRFQRESFSKVTGSYNKLIADVPPTYEWPHYNATLGHTVKFATLLYDLPMHVIATALEREVDKDGLSVAQPMLLGQSAGEVSAIALTVMRMVPKVKLPNAVLKAASEELGDEDVISVGYLAPNPRYVAKDQHGIGHTWLANPTMADFCDGIGM